MALAKENTNRLCKVIYTVNTKSVIDNGLWICALICPKSIESSNDLSSLVNALYAVMPFISLIVCKSILLQLNFLLDLMQNN